MPVLPWVERARQFKWEPASANLWGPRSRRDRADVKALLAAGAGAGLATAFSSPLGGAVFVLEELVRRFDTRITITTLCASGSAIAVARLFLGNERDFQLPTLTDPGFGALPIFLVRRHRHRMSGHRLQSRAARRAGDL